ncbi:MAG TPA: hypothetical protein DGT23_21750, partial [Micromonosporaceae bacterium]|nr:hypothetical protein [Micromonosporaceae bacterium]
GFLAGYRNSNVQLTSQLRLLQWWEQPATEPPEQDSQLQVALTLGISTGGYLDDAASAVAQLYRGYDLSYQLFLVPPRATVVYQVAFRVRTSVSHGKALVDFDGGAFQITCPNLLLITMS